MGVFVSKKEIGPDTVLQRRNDILFNEISGEVVMLSVENGEYYGMDKVGSRIWELLIQPIIFKELIIKLLNEYDITKEHCISDALVFLNKLKDKKLILIDKS